MSFDVCVIGGGMVGASVALGFAQRGFQVAIVEQKLPAAFDPDSEPDMRVSAISAASQSLLSELGAWEHIEAMRLCPFRRLSVWEKPQCRTDFNANDIKAPLLGHIIENRVVQLGIHQALANYDNVVWFSNVGVDDYQGGPSSSVKLSDGSELTARLVVGADGVHSRIRELARIGVQGWQYKQQALGIKVRLQGPQQDITWQQFSATGPKAFLPLCNGYGSLVWYHQPDMIKQLKQLNTAKLKEQILTHFPAELGEFEVLDSASFPLLRQHANQYLQDNLVLIGDAAHSINPLAGQGVNLGFKDVACLFQQLDKDAVEDGISAQALREYASIRRRDNLIMMSAMDVLYKTFSNDLSPVATLRNLGLKLANHTGPLKQQAMKYAMGL